MNSTEIDNNKRFNKAKELKNSTTLKRYKSCNYPEIVSIVDHLCDELVCVYGLKLTRKSSIAKLKYHIEFFVLNLYKVYCRDPKKVIAYSRDRNAYSGKESRYKNKFGLSFRYCVDDSNDGKPVISFLERQGYIETFSFQFDRRNPNKRFQSRMRATPKLINLIVDQHKVSEVMIDEDTSTDELIIVKGLKPKPKRIEVVVDGKKRTRKIQSPRKICKTPDKPIVREMRKNLEIINEVMEKAEITLDISDDELTKLNARMLDDPDPYKQAIDFSRKRLYRVFLDRRLDRGGRFYGPWYQNIPKEYRQNIMVNGAPTLELDYSALHPNILYHYADVDPPKGDLYELEGCSKETRKFLKGIFLRLINAKSRDDAKGSIREAAFYRGKVDIPKELGNLEDKYLDPLIDAFLEKHKALKQFIFRVKDLGNILQCFDSKLAEKILLYFAYDGIPVLPLHDSFRIDARIFDKLQEIMHKVIITNLGRPIRISNDDFIPLFKRLFDKVDKQIEEKSYDEDALVALIKDLQVHTMKIESNLQKLDEIRNRRQKS